MTGRRKDIPHNAAMADLSCCNLTLPEGES